MPGIAERIKVGRKFDQVVKGARTVFMRDGYEGASVDDIAREAGVSKATLYSYFPDKRLLFTEVAAREYLQQADNAVAEIDQSQPPRRVLTEAARHLIRFSSSAFGMAIYRISVAEAARFPDIGRKFYDSGLAIVERELTAYFDKAIGRGELVIADRGLAAHQFAELCRADWFARLLFGVQTTFTAAEFDRVITGAVEAFLARYGV